MLIHHQFDPIAFSIGPLSVHWYGLMYLVGFACFWFLGTYRAKKDAWRQMDADKVEDLLFFIRIWDGGMSAHGGILGVIAAMAYFAKTRNIKFFVLSDFVVPLVPLGLFFGRIGNFINGELWGRVCSPDFALAMVFPQAADNLPRHPSQLYEATLEGLLLFILLWCYSTRQRSLGRVSALFCLGYGVSRFIVEFFREPDAFLGLLALGLSQGQWLSLPLIAVGLIVWFWPVRARR